ncbi:unnamed protein product (macronuclear) [Paramecium tetraurelia]|uniref:Uncharacterized protein n=1 Tax=Paramecium tetraurelia TaxID=5888 RepID=A0CC11_PARTE|nr:uncharacterized protein GSPATT00037112001 [Paramecium tetraurelia]CAK68328.1 unnamed protein product [Paramecium tetraurelia]|eukprot:XP_001435725.1 hypothetical protein (macronuclear) [Paramecium tetraurelia strain d4-2]
MKEEENQIIKQEEQQLYIQQCPIPVHYTSIPNEIQHYQSTFQVLAEENHHLRKLLNLNQQHQLICLTKEQLQEEVYKMIDFLMRHLNYLSKEQIFAYQKAFRFWTQKKALKSVFFQIFTRYLQVVKTREEMIKFIIRKSMKHQRQTQSKEQMKEKKVIKKMNNSFVKQLFQNTSYQQDYSNFLNQYLQLALNENQQKIRKYVVFIMEMIVSDQINQVLNYKRFPWLNDWINQSVQLAQELQNPQNQNQESKKRKI